jgi:hypothetical protein
VRSRYLPTEARFTIKKPQVYARSCDFLLPYPQRGDFDGGHPGDHLDAVAVEVPTGTDADAAVAAPGREPAFAITGRRVPALPVDICPCR